MQKKGVDHNAVFIHHCPSLCSAGQLFAIMQKAHIIEYGISQQQTRAEKKAFISVTVFN